MVVSNTDNSADAASSAKPTIGIQAFESATTMSCLVCLNYSLSDRSLRVLRSDTMRSDGVSYLTSTDQHFLFRLVFSDLLSDLDSSAAAVSRLSSRSRSHHNFPLTYSQLKLGRTPFTTPFSSKGINRRVKQMEKNIALIAKLLEEIETLDTMEKKKPPPLEAELKSQRKKIAKLKEESLWNKTFDEVVSIISRVVIAIFARICVVFGPFVAGLPPVFIDGGRFRFTTKFRIYPRLLGRNHASGPIERAPARKEFAIRNSCPIIGKGRETEPKNIAKDTVGRAGLSLLYANVVVTAGILMRIRCGEVEAEKGQEAVARDEIYRQLPVKMHGMIKGKLRERWRERGVTDGELAKGWREAVERILRWLEPVAVDTVTWQAERTLDRRRRLNSTGSRVLAIQTLEFSDREKTEAAIVEVLVGISCMCWYDGRPSVAAARGGYD